MGAMAPSELVLLLEGLARTQCRLPAPWLAEFFAHSARQLPACE